MITVLFDFNKIERKGYIKLEKHLIPEGTTYGTLITLTSPSSNVPRFATLYETDENWHYLRLQA